MPRHAIITVALATLILAGCHKKGGEPQPVGSTIYVAVRDWPDGQVVDPLYFIDADSLTVYDSIPGANAMWDIAASPDGRWIYTMVDVGRDADSVRKIDVHSKVTAWTIGSRHRVDLNLLDNGNLLLIGPTDLVRTSDGTLVERFADSLQRGLGPVGGTRVAAVRKSDSAMIYGTDVITGEVYGAWEPRRISGEMMGLLGTIVLHPDNRRVLAIGVYGFFQNSWFLVGDLETGETLLEQRLYSPGGEIAISGDGSMALAGDPGRSGLWTRRGMDAIDLVEMKHVARFEGFGGQAHFISGTSKAILAPIPDYWSSVPAGRGLPVINPKATDGFEGAEWVFFDLPSPLIGAIGIGPRLTH